MPYADPERQQQWTREHRDCVRASQRRHAERTAEQRRIASRQRYAADPEIFKRWARENPEISLRSKLRNGAQQRAKKLGLAFDLALSDIFVPEFCPVLGLKLKRNSGFPGDTSPSLDRVIPSLGYVRGNIRVISHRANVIKGNGSAEEHRKIAEYIDASVSAEDPTGGAADEL